MMLFVEFRHPLPRDVGIDLRGRYVSVTKHRLKRAQISAAIEHVRGKGMSQHMRTDPFRAQASMGGHLFQQNTEFLAGKF